VTVSNTLESELLLRSASASINKIMDLLEMADGQSVEELAGNMGKGVKWVRDRLRQLAAEDRLEVGRKQVKNLTGAMQWVPVYKIKSEAE